MRRKSFATLALAHAELLGRARIKMKEPEVGSIKELAKLFKDFS